MIFGIDFGTTYTIVSWWEKDKLQDKLHFLDWGDEKYYKRTVFDNVYNLKRSVQKYETQIQNFFKELSAKIEAQTGIVEIKKCVLTTPMRFSDIERNIIKKAAIYGGFYPVKLLAEPVAAAIHALDSSINSSINSSLDSSLGDNKEHYGATDNIYIVYDLGGGTFDLTLLKYSRLCSRLCDGQLSNSQLTDNQLPNSRYSKDQHSIFQILATGGLANFGGIEIDKIFASRYGCDLETARSIKEEYFKNPNLHDKEINFQVDLLLEDTYRIVDSVAYGYSVNSIILVGGSCNIPLIYDHLSSKYNVIMQDQDIDKYVSIGAADYGRMLLDNQNMLIDACSFNLGIETADGSISIIIPQNTPLPTRKSEKFVQIGDQGVVINILQGNLDDFVSLKKIELKIEDRLQQQSNLIGVEEKIFDVIFSIDCDGIISVQIGEYIDILNFAEIAIEADKEIVAIYENIKNRDFNDLTEEQRKFIIYLQHALKMKLENPAKEWILNYFNKLFN